MRYQRFLLSLDIERIQAHGEANAKMAEAIAMAQKGIEHWKATGLDFSRLFYQPNVPADVPRLHVSSQEHGLEKALDVRLIEKSKAALEKGEKVQFIEVARNVNRTVGAMLSGELIRQRPEANRRGKRHQCPRSPKRRRSQCPH